MVNESSGAANTSAALLRLPAGRAAGDVDVARACVRHRGVTNHPRLDASAARHTDLRARCRQRRGIDAARPGHAEAHLFGPPSHLRPARTGEAEVKLLRLDRNRYLGDRWWCEEINVVRDADDQVTGFTLTADGGNIQKLRFVKL